MDNKKIIYKFVDNLSNAKDNQGYILLALLLYCLQQKGYLSITKNTKKNIIFKVNIKPDKLISTKDASVQNLSTYEVVYNIPQNILPHWTDVINYFQNQYFSRIENNNEGAQLYAFFIEKLDDPVDEGNLKLYNLAKELIENGEKDSFFQFSEIFKQLLFFINKCHRKFYFNFQKLAILKDLLNAEDNAEIFNPFAGPALYSYIINNNETYIGCTCSKLSYYIGRLFLLTQQKIKKFDWFLYNPNLKDEKQYKYIIFDLKLDRNTLSNFEMAKVENSVLDFCLKKLSCSGRMACILYNPDEYRNIKKTIIKELFSNNWIESIFTHESGLLILLINKERNLSSPVHQYSIPGFQIDYDIWKKISLEPNKNLIETGYFLTNAQNFHEEDYYLSLNPKAKWIMQNEDMSGFKSLRLGIFLRDNNLDKIVEIQKKEKCLLSQDTISKIKFPYYPYNPIISATDCDTTDNIRHEGIDLFHYSVFHLVNKTSLIFNSEHGSFVENGVLINYYPLVFDSSNGEIITDTVTFEIDTTQLDPEYLALQMSKSYFKAQLETCCLSSGMISIHSKDIEHLLSLYIKVPNCLTSLERQKQIVSIEKWQHIKKTATNIGKDLSILSTADDTFLKSETTLYNNKYTIKDYLGHGGFGRTYLARNMSPKAYDYLIVAIKEFFVNGYQKRNPETNEVIPCLDKNLHLLENARKKFYREASIIKKFSDCPNIIKVFDIFDENGTTYYTMEYMENGNLCNYCKIMGQNGILDEFDAKRIIREVANALSAMHHHKFNHFDVKPSNILIDNDGHAKLIDFGTVKFFGNDATTTTCNMSSPGYSAPEMYQLKEFSPQADIYSLGATLRYMLEGDATHADCSGFSQPKPMIPTRLKALIDQCLDNEPSCRPKDIEDFLERLDCC